MAPKNRGEGMHAGRHGNQAIGAHACLHEFENSFHVLVDCQFHGDGHAAQLRCQYPQKSTLGLLCIANPTTRSAWEPFGSLR
jgi:hypothetical protein